MLQFSYHIYNFVLQLLLIILSKTDLSLIFNSHSSFILQEWVFHNVGNIDFKETIKLIDLKKNCSFIVLEEF